MSDLVDFLRQRLDEDEQAARNASPSLWKDPGEDESDALWLPPEDAYHIYRWEPERVLAEVEAKRRIVHAHARPHECLTLTGSGEHSVVDGEPWELWEAAHTEDHGPCYVLRCLALPYADHPDYREEWRL